MAFSLPGISELASSTVSPVPTRIMWSRLAIRDSAAIGSPCDPVQTSVTFSSASFSMPYTVRSASIMARESTDTERFDVSSYIRFPTRLWMLPSKISPTTSPARLIEGDPELPPMMSHAATKFIGVFGFSFDFAAAQRSGMRNGQTFSRSAERAYRPAMLVNGATCLPACGQPFTAPYERRSVNVASG